MRKLTKVMAAAVTAAGLSTTALAEDSNGSFSMGDILFNLPLDENGYFPVIEENSKPAPTLSNDVRELVKGGMIASGFNAITCVLVPDVFAEINQHLEGTLGNPLSDEEKNILICLDENEKPIAFEEKQIRPRLRPKNLGQN